MGGVFFVVVGVLVGVVERSGVENGGGRRRVLLGLARGNGTNNKLVDYRKKGGIAVKRIGLF